MVGLVLFGYIKKDTILVDYTEKDSICFWKK